MKRFEDYRTKTDYMLDAVKEAMLKNAAGIEKSCTEKGGPRGGHQPEYFPSWKSAESSYISKVMKKAGAPSRVLIRWYNASYTKIFNAYPLCLLRDVWKAEEEYEQMEAEKKMKKLG